MPNLAPLRRDIPGWGADLDPKNRPGVPREKRPPRDTGAHWKEPERQIADQRIFKSTEHARITPVFGTSCPPRWVSGKIRELAYHLSEGRKSHWLLLLFADRVDVVESAFESLFTLRPHNPLAEMGLEAELKRGAFRSRFGQGRVDVERQAKQLALVAGLGAAVAVTAGVLGSRKKSSNRAA